MKSEKIKVKSIVDDLDNMDIRAGCIVLHSYCGVDMR